MDTTKDTAPPATRELRGIKLYREHGDEIIHEGRGVYTVPGCSGGSYRVDLAVFGGEESCSCPDFTAPRRNREPGEPCKHLYAATIFRARSRVAARRVQVERMAARASRGNLAGLAASL
jgi:hypothetical protein